METFWAHIIPDEKSKIALLSIISNSLLVFLKLIAGIMTNSVSILSEAIHSSLDLMAAVIAYIAVRISRKPPDKEHKYGHGKYENVSGTIEAILIFIAAVWIIFEAYHKLINKTPVETLMVGVAVMAVSTLVNYLISAKLMQTAKKTHSIALEADAMHLRTDVFTSLGVLIGLALMQLTGLTILDPLIAVIVALLIIKAAYDLSVKAFEPLLDTALEDTEENAIRAILDKAVAEDKLAGYHKLRTRQSGAEKYIDLHMVVSPDITVESAHETAHNIEDEIREQLDYANVLIHVEPCVEKWCKQNCEGCDKKMEPLKTS